MLPMPPEEPGNDWKWFWELLWGLLELVGAMVLMLTMFWIIEKIGE